MSEPTNQKPLAANRFGHRALREFKTTIFTTMTQLALQHNAINLGQGFPDSDGPQTVLDKAKESIDNGCNQYPPLGGTADLKTAISAHRERFWGLSIDSASEIHVTAGATEAIAASLFGLVQPGDEVIVFEPLYDSYAACIAMAGATLVPVTLAGPSGEQSGWSFSEAALRSAVTKNTTSILLNTPHNPCGKVFTHQELELIAEIAVANDLIVISDEVYEHLVFDDKLHISAAQIPALKDRCVTISSGGKTFSTTGWKVGWVCGPSEMIQAIKQVTSYLTFVNAGPFQPAIAAGLLMEDRFFESLASGLQHKRDLLAEGLKQAGFKVYQCDATYFLTADISELTSKTAVEFALELPQTAGVVAIPCSVFYASEGEARSLLRFAFCKQDQILQQAADQLIAARPLWS